jgi:hypothetical protein
MHSRTAQSFRVVWLGLAGLVAWGLAAAQDTPPPSQALAAYVAKPDASYRWRIQRRYRDPDADILELHLESQTWQGGRRGLDRQRRPHGRVEDERQHADAADRREADAEAVLGEAVAGSGFAPSAGGDRYRAVFSTTVTGWPACSISMSMRNR